MSLTTEQGTQTFSADASDGPAQTRPSIRKRLWELWANRPGPVRTFVAGRALLAIFLSLLLWGYVTNTVDPQQPVTLRDLTVQVKNVPDGLVVTQQPPPVNLTFIAAKATRDNVNASDFSLYVDLHDIPAGSPSLPVQLAKKPDVSNIEINPSNVDVVVERIKTLHFQVSVKPINGPQVGYSLGVQTITPSDVTISGAQSQVDKVRSVQIDLGAINPQSDIDETLAPTPLDAQGHLVSDITLTPPQVHVHIPVTLQVNYKAVPIRLNIKGVPAPGYAPIAVTTDLTSQTVNVWGDPADLAKIDSISTDPIDISGAAATVVKTVGLTKLPNVSVLGNTRITVTITIAPAQTSTLVNVNVTYENRNLAYDVVFDPPTISVTLSGTYQDVSNLPLVRAVVDVAGLEPGVYHLQPVIRDAGNLTVGAVSPVTVTITALPTATPEPTATATPIPYVPPTATATLVPTSTPPATPAPVSVNPTSVRTTPPAAQQTTHAGVSVTPGTSPLTKQVPPPATGTPQASLL